jgi:hypothetical protein
VFQQIVQALVNALLAIPAVRFVMGLVEARWRPLWATLWLALIAYVVARTMNQLAGRRLRLQMLRESLNDPHAGKPREATAGDPNATAPLGNAPIAVTSSADATPSEPVARAVAPPVVPTPAAMLRASVPLPVVLAAVGAGALAVAGVAFAIRAVPNATPPADATAAVAPDTAAPAEKPMDIRWRSGRMDDDDCIGTFEISNGTGTRARFKAFVMDTSGAVMARDSARVEAAVSGLFVEFRFRHVDCDEIDDWRLEATTPKRRD